MFFSQVKRTVKTAIAFALAAGFFCLLRIAYAERFPTLEGERNYYLYSPSSQATIAEKLPVDKLGFLTGESVALDGGDPKEIFASYGAELLFVESAEGITSYYGYSDRLAGGKLIAGRLVNLHVAKKGTRVVVGSPLIFGGF